MHVYYPTQHSLVVGVPTLGCICVHVSMCAVLPGYALVCCCLVAGGVHTHGYDVSMCTKKNNLCTMLALSDTLERSPGARPGSLGRGPGGDG